MKLESLTIIFVIIMIPIIMVLAEYIDNIITAKETELEYDTRLLNSTYDAIKAYQLNTVNNAFGDVTNSKIQDIEAAVNTLYNSLASNFNYTGYQSDVMKEYVPAIVFTLYDGYYIYAPFSNTLTEVADDAYDPEYSEAGEVMDGLKPYVYYSCRYTKGANTDFVITYTLDNYITIQGMINNQYIYDYGYLYSIAETANGNGIYYNEINHTYTYEGITFSENNTEELKEFVGDTEYSYAKINGTKYYLDENYDTSRTGEIDLGNGETISASSGIFFIDSDGTKNYSQARYNGNGSTSDQEFLQYCRAIKNNKSAYEYYKNAYEFSRAVLGTPVAGYTDKSGEEITTGYGLANLKVEDAEIWNNPASDDISFKTYYGENYKDTIIFDDTHTNLENKNSNFNEHRSRIIRYVVETNLSTSIASFSTKTGSSDLSFVMPRISDADWDLIQNNVCAISFLQGMSIGTKKYNGYAVVSNNLTKEYIDEDDIYILTEDTTNNIRLYSKSNDGTLNESTTNIIDKAILGYYPGVWKLNFEAKQYRQTNADENDVSIYYYPMTYIRSDGTKVVYQGSYTSVMGSYNVIPTNTVEIADMYEYIKSTTNTALKTAYYTALGRERWGSYNVNNINYELYGNNGNQYFLQSY